MTEPITPTPPKKPTRRKIDWEAIELDYRTGIKTLRQMGQEYAVSEGAIRKRAKRDGWERDLSSKINAKAESKVRKSQVRTEVRNPEEERQIIEDNATAIANVRIGQRKDIQRSRAIVNRLMDEMELMCGEEHAALLEQLGEAIKDDGGNKRRLDVFNRVIDFSNRVKSAKELAEALRTVVALEREAFGITNKDDEAAKDDPLTRILHEIAKNNSSAIQPKL